MQEVEITKGQFSATLLLYFFLFLSNELIEKLSTLYIVLWGRVVISNRQGLEVCFASVPFGIGFFEYFSIIFAIRFFSSIGASFQFSVTYP